MAKFWHTEPIHELLQRPGTLPYGLYPSVQFHISTDKWSVQQPYARPKFEEMLAWVVANVRKGVTYSERYGSWHFGDEQERAMFRLFFGDDTMPEPTHWPGMENPPRLK